MIHAGRTGVTGVLTLDKPYNDAPGGRSLIPQVIVRQL